MMTKDEELKYNLLVRFQERLKTLEAKMRDVEKDLKDLNQSMAELFPQVMTPATEGMVWQCIDCKGWARDYKDIQGLCEHRIILTQEP